MAHLSLVTLGVADLDRATRFYERLGWQRSAASVEGTVTFLRGGATVLALYGRADLAADSGLGPPAAAPGRAPLAPVSPPSPPPMPVPATAPTPAPLAALATNVASEAEVDAMLSAAAEAGGTVTRAAERAEWGGCSGYFTDPDGHLWEVACNPGFPLLPDGRVRLPDDPG